MDPTEDDIAALVDDLKRARQMGAKDAHPTDEELAEGLLRLGWRKPGPKGPQLQPPIPARR